MVAEAISGEILKARKPDLIHCEAACLIDTLSCAVVMVNGGLTQVQACQAAEDWAENSQVKSSRQVVY